MNFRAFLGFCFITFATALFGCGGFDIYSPEQIHRTVRSQGMGRYVVTYKWRYVIDNYGPDMAMLLKGVDDKDKKDVWKRATVVAVPKYLEAKGIVPSECTQGVTIIRSGEVEGGGSWAEFLCQ